MSTFASDDCEIYRVRPQGGRRGQFWCVVHDAAATARFGGRLPRCEGAYQTIATHKRFSLTSSNYPGGVALWGAVEPVYNTTRWPAERGIHVHARLLEGTKKDIDQTFDAVELEVSADLFDRQKVLITADTAVAYYISRFLGRRIDSIFCPYCGAPHLDSDWFAVKPHRTHLCHACHELFRQDIRLVSNPLAIVQHQLRAGAEKAPKRANGSLDIAQRDYPAGLQIWASNPSIFWTRPRPEEEGIHVHAWKTATAGPRPDGTFGHVRIDGIELDEQQLRYYMAQNSLAYLRGKVVALRCPSCKAHIFETGEAAFRPRSLHECSGCGTAFPSPGRRRRVVSNPFVDTIKVLKAASKGAV